MYMYMYSVYAGRKAWICAICGLPCAKCGSALPAGHSGLTHNRATPGLRTHDEREGQLLATWPAILNDNHL